MAGMSSQSDTPLNMTTVVSSCPLNMTTEVVSSSPLNMTNSDSLVYVPVSTGAQEEVFSLVNYNVADEIDEGYSTNYSPSSKSTSSFECDNSFERTENTNSDIQYVTGQIGEKIEDEKGNMMWLVDFKLDFLNDIEKNGEKRTQDYESVEQNKRIKLSEVQDSCLALDDNDSPLNLSHLGHPPATLLTSTVTPASTVTETGGSKPNYTYTDLITLALRDKTSLTVSGIYQWITDNFPYYKAEDDRWKNSVRHNLSMNPNFRKGGRAKQGTGHVWVLADQNDLNRQETLSEPSKKDTTDEAIRKILQSSFPKTSGSSAPAQAGQVKRKVAGGSHAKSCNKIPSQQQQQQQIVKQQPLISLPIRPCPPLSQSSSHYTVIDTTGAAYDMSEYTLVAPPPPLAPVPVQYTQVPLPPQFISSEYQHQQYDFSVSDSDRLVRALGLDFSEPVQRELSAK